MSSRFNTLLHGDLHELFNILGGDTPPDTIPELRAALTNVVRKLLEIERRHEEEDGRASEA